MAFPSKKAVALDIRKTAKKENFSSEDVAELCKVRGISLNTYYKWGRIKSKSNQVKLKVKNGRRKRVISELPSIPTTIIPPTMIASPMCPPGYVMVMIPLASLANLFGGPY